LKLVHCAWCFTESYALVPSKTPRERAKPQNTKIPAPAIKSKNNSISAEKPDT
jgi:hypothetical protein